MLQTPAYTQSLRHPGATPHVLPVTDAHRVGPGTGPTKTTHDVHHDAHTLLAAKSAIRPLLLTGAAGAARALGAPGCGRVVSRQTPDPPRA